MTREELDERLSEIQNYAWKAAVTNADNPLQEKLLDAHFSQVRDLIRDCIEAVTPARIPDTGADDYTSDVFNEVVKRVEANTKELLG